MLGRRESGVALTIALLAAALVVVAPSYFSPGNLRYLALANLPVLIVAIGTTLVLLSGEIDISCGSMFAVCSVVAGVVAKASSSVALASAAAIATGAALGALNGSLVAFARIPSIVVTLAALVALRDGLRWATGGAWVTDLPPSFQWFGVSQGAYPLVALLLTLGVGASVGWALRRLAAGRWVYAVGSDASAARLAGIHVERVKAVVFALAGTLTGLAAVINAARFNQVPSNSGLGLEMKVIAAAVVGGASVTGGAGTLFGTVLGVVLLGAVGPALTFLGVSASWERGLQGAIILVAVAVDGWRWLRPQRSAPARRSHAAV